ncbi:MAG: T9SS C-terminal target domain-containing protein [Bacteroidetes bacterium]|nr:T9SS C-terminal target domain-containing protein [Bacteroidota bacterium]
MRYTSIVLVVVALLGLAAAANAQIVPGAVALPDSITGTRILSADSVYQLVNTVKVGPGALISIPPGTVIYGNANGVRSCLQIERGGKIYARGTPTAPIIFTSAKPQGQRAPGDWGGVILLGRANVNPTGDSAIIEGGTNGIFGGTDDADSSGVMEYVRIEYGGLAFAVDNEINGLTFGGVGNRTVIDHIQCSYTNDDSFEWFGGTVNCKYLIAFAGVDDDIDTDNGFRGHLQFIFAFRDSLESDLSASSSSNGFEADNDATGSANTPISKPIVSNATMVGPFRDTNEATWGQDFARGAHIRRNTDYGIFNTVITGWPEIRIDGTGENPACPQNTDLVFENVVITGKTTEIFAAAGANQATCDQWFDCAGASNTRAGNHSASMLTAVTQANLHNPDPRPLPGSPVATGTSFTNTLLTGNNFTFTNVPYKGAFDPAVARDQQWDMPWSNYDPQITTYVKLRQGWNLVGLANTPANNDKNVVFPNNGSNAFRYNNGYTVDNTLDAGVGYWVLLNDNATVEQTGATVSLPRTVSVQAGWNLVCTGASVPATVANTTATGTHVNSVFGFNNGYTTATTLEPGKAYWVNVTTAGTLTFNP